jgi:hypothetical protein
VPAKRQLKFGNNSANRSTFEHRKYFYNQNPWLRQIAAGSLEIETGTQAVDFDAIVLDDTVPNNFRATSVAEVAILFA